MKNHLRSTKWLLGVFITGVLSTNGFAGMSGFVDAQIGGGTGYGQQAGNSVGFKVADGAMYLSKELGKGKVMVDLPFSFGVGNGNNFAFAQTKAQAYINYGYDFGLDWTLGRFDTPFGIEANDTVDVTYTRVTNMKSGNLPVVHNGLMLHYSNNGFELKGLASNATGKGDRLTASGDADNLEYGFLAKYTAAAWWAGAGYYMYKPAGAETSSIIDIMFGTKVSDFSINVEALLTKAAITGVDSGLSIAGDVVYTINKEWSFGLRPELNNKQGGVGATTLLGGTYSQFAITAGPQAKVTDDLKVKLDYNYSSTKSNAVAGTWTDPGGSATTAHAGVLSAVYKW